MNIPEISVVIAVFNGSQYISETLESIVLQSFSNWECIIVDDGSTDDTLEIIQNFIDNDNRFKIIKTNGGNGSYIAANIGIKAAKGKYIARTDADDISLPERLRTQYNFFESNLNINVCGSQHYYLFENNKISLKLYNVDVNFLKWQLIFRNKIVHSTMMFRKNWFEKLGYYPQKRLAQDWHIWLEASHNNTLHILEKPLVKWRIHNNSITKKESSNQLDLASEVAVYHLTNRLNFNNIDFNIVKSILASLRGDKIESETNIAQTISFLTLVYEKVIHENNINKAIKSKIKLDLHTIIDSCFVRQSSLNKTTILLYLQTFRIAGMSKIWIKGLLRHLLKK